MRISSNKKAGVKDIAAKAGVSIGTVDRVLHNRGEVKEETRKKILKIVNELGYTPNLLAKSLSSRKRTRLAIVIPDASDDNPYWKIPIKGIEKAADELVNFQTEVNYIFFDASNEASFRKVLHQVKEEAPDGLVLNPVFRESSLEYINEFNMLGIPFVFIDVNLYDVNTLGYFGQDAQQSGQVAGKLMSEILDPGARILILKQTNRKVFSRHIESRIEGFLEFIAKNRSERPFSIDTIEIDLLEKAEPEKSLSALLNEETPFSGIFIPNSRAFKIANFLKAEQDFRPVIIAYDLLEENITLLKEGMLSYLISQKPDQQAYRAIMSLFDHLVSKKEIRRTNYSPIDIIIKENLDFYLNSG